MQKLQKLTPEQRDSKLVEKHFEKITKIAISEGWLCRNCHKPTTISKNKPLLFRIADYMSDKFPLEYCHSKC